MKTKVGAALCATFIAAGASLAVAQDWYEGEFATQCSDETTTADIVQCTGGLVDKWDARLNIAYKELADTLEADRRRMLRDAQRSWIAYRDANCAFYRSAEGSIAAIEGNVCIFALTRDRALEIEEMTAN